MSTCDPRRETTTVRVGNDACGTCSHEIYTRDGEYLFVGTLACEFATKSLLRELAFSSCVALSRRIERNEKNESVLSHSYTTTTWRESFPRLTHPQH